MRFEGQVTIKAPRERVWGFLTDPEKVSGCAPGLESLEIVVPSQRFRAVASVGFGSLRVTFASDAEWLDLEAPRRARMKVHATAPGSAADVTSEMELQDAAEGATSMRWTADVSVVGTIASLAARLMGSVAQRLTDRFFETVRGHIEAHREFRFGPLPLADALGKVLGHNVAGADGRILLRKGRPLSAGDVAALRGLGRTLAYVAEPGTDDVDENAAARRVAEAAQGAGLRLSGGASGRVNLLAGVLGVLRVDAERLGELNECEGITLATLATHTTVRPSQVVATVKAIPFALPQRVVREAERIASDGAPLLRVDPILPRPVGLVLSGSAPARARIAAGFSAPLGSRLDALGAPLSVVDFVHLEEAGGEAALAAALRRQIGAGMRLVILAGETAIVDRHDIAPRAVERAGGEVACFGAPVDPGNLLLLAYVGSVPVLGVPGCARSLKENVVDRVLPRLLAGERMSRADIVALGHGGLLEDVPERPLPRGEA